MKIKSITKIKSDAKRYDIEVEKNHNFYANNILVHNSNVYTEYFHARSMDSKHHLSRSWLKGYITAWQHEIPFGWRFCGENMYAKHSIYYKNLESYFYLFSIWDAKNCCLSWKDTKEYADLLDLVTVPIIYEGIFDIDKIQNIFDTEFSDQEGYVVRIADKFHYNDFSTSVAKWVRKNHVQTSDHWMFDKITPNELKKD